MAPKKSIALKLAQRYSDIIDLPHYGDLAKALCRTCICIDGLKPSVKNRNMIIDFDHDIETLRKHIGRTCWGIQRSYIDHIRDNKRDYDTIIDPDPKDCLRIMLSKNGWFTTVHEHKTMFPGILQEHLSENTHELIKLLGQLRYLIIDAYDMYQKTQEIRSDRLMNIIPYNSFPINYLYGWGYNLQYKNEFIKHYLNIYYPQYEILNDFHDGHYNIRLYEDPFMARLKEHEYYMIRKLKKLASNEYNRVQKMMNVYWKPEIHYNFHVGIRVKIVIFLQCQKYPKFPFPPEIVDHICGLLSLIYWD